MARYLNQDFWREALRQPDWYLIPMKDFERLEKLAGEQENYTARKAVKAEAYQLVEEALTAQTLPLANRGDNLDIERKPVDTIIIHHTGSRPGMTLDRLNAMQLLRIYGGYYANPTDLREQHFKGKPVWSGHFYKDRQVFWGYHWLVRDDGNAEQILDDSYVGWHAGNWDVNTRSIGICIDNDLTGKQPSRAALRAVADIIHNHYRQVGGDKILGHRDVNHHTECPGDRFHSEWRQLLIQQAS